MNNALQLGPGDPRQLGPYTILNRIGGGGMGVVYLGQSPDRRLVAVKVVRSDRASDPEFVARFRREVRAASGVAGFCTARVLAADLDAHQPYYVTEATAFGEYLKKAKPNAKVAVLYQNDGFGKDFLGGFQKEIEGSDIKIVATTVSQYIVSFSRRSISFAIASEAASIALISRFSCP